MPRVVVALQNCQSDFQKSFLEIMNQAILRRDPISKIAENFNANVKKVDC
jgi:hypothetical protein